MALSERRACLCRIYGIIFWVGRWRPLSEVGHREISQGRFKPVSTNRVSVNSRSLMDSTNWRTGLIQLLSRTTFMCNWRELDAYRWKWLIFDKPKLEMTFPINFLLKTSWNSSINFYEEQSSPHSPFMSAASSKISVYKSTRTSLRKAQRDWVVDFATRSLSGECGSD